MVKRETGTVKWFNDRKGYGFIERDRGGDVFVHFSDINALAFQTLKTGQRVKFTVVEVKKGLQARNVAWMA